jgi:exonuclease SbcD
VVGGGPCVVGGVRLPAPEPALVRRVTDVLEDRAARLVRIERVMTGSPAPLARTASHTSLRDLTPETVFRRLYQREHAGEPEAELLATFHEALDAAAHEAPL